MVGEWFVRKADETFLPEVLGASAIECGGVRPLGFSLRAPGFDGEREVIAFDAVAPELDDTSSALTI